MSENIRVNNRKFIEELSKYRIKCKCGHTFHITNARDFKICNFCGRKVYRNAKCEFIDKLKTHKIYKGEL